MRGWHLRVSSAAIAKRYRRPRSPRWNTQVLAQSVRRMDRRLLRSFLPLLLACLAANQGCGSRDAGNHYEGFYALGFFPDRHRVWVFDSLGKRVGGFGSLPASSVPTPVHVLQHAYQAALVTNPRRAACSHCSPAAAERIFRGKPTSASTCTYSIGTARLGRF